MKSIALEDAPRREYLHVPDQLLDVIDDGRLLVSRHASGRTEFIRIPLERVPEYKRRLRRNLRCKDSTH